MKQNKLNKLWLRATMLVALMCVAFTNVWADEVTDVLDRSFTGVTGTSYSSWSGKTATSGAVYAGQSAGGNESIQLRSNNSNSGVITTTSGGKVKKITVDWQSATSNGRTLNVYGKNSAYSDASDLYDSSNQGTLLGTIVKGTSTTLEVDDDYEYIGFRSASGAMYLTSVSIVWETAGGGGTELEDCDFALTGAPVALSFDLYNNSSAQVINYTTSSTGAITIADNDYATFDIDEENKTITVTPTAVTPSEQTITVSQTADESYKAGSATFTVTITDSTPIPTHTVTFSVNGETTSDEVEEGAAITFPSDPEDVSGKTFVGWVTEAIDGTTDEAPEFVTSANMGQSNVTYYAVFAYVDGASEAGSVELTPTTDGVPSSYGTANTFSEYTFGGVEFQIMQMYKNSGKLQWRAAGNSSGTGTMYNSESLGKIESVVLTYNSSDANKNFTLKVGNTANPTDGEAITPSSNGLVYTFDCSSYNFGFFVLANGSGAGYLDKLVINYTIGSSTISGYCTTVVAAAVERPVITVAENPFLFSTTATITCETEGATIKYSFDGETWNDYTEELTITATTTLYAKAVKDVNESEVASVTITKNLAVPAVAIDATGITNTNVFDGTEAGSLVASVTYNDAAVEGATVTWSGNNDEVATIDENGAVTLVAAGTVTFTATYAGNDDFAEKTATYEMTVTNSDPNAPGTENNPYTVAEAIAFIGTLGSATSATEVYVSGIISQVDSYNSKYGSITYWISDNGTTESQMEVYSGLNIGGEQFSAKEDLLVGDIVTVKGYVKMYNTTPEFDKNNIIVSFERPVVTTPSIEVSTTTVEAPAAGLEGTIEVTYNNITDVVAEVKFYEADGTTEATHDWVVASINSINNVEYIIDANESTEARTAYMKVYALDDETNDVYSELITITQAGYVVDYATLPFAWDDKDTPTGITNYGVGTYSSSPYLKFDGSGDEIILKLNEAPGVLFFDIKGNSFSGGTFTVQTSADDQTYDELATYTELGATQTEAFSLNSDVRYIKWVYTEKVSGNVALGNIIVDVAQVATVGAAKYATYVPKYNVSFPGEVEAYITSEVNTEKGYVSMTQVTAVPKGTPVVLKNEGEYVLAPAAADALADVSSNQLKASDTDIEANGTQYVLAKLDEEVGFYKAKEGTTIVAGKAYLQIEGAGVKGFTFKFGDDATSINEELRVKSEESSIYNLAGQRVSKMQRGINIVNGKKLLK